MDIPGAKASRWWLQQFPQARRVPIVGGKDPGEAYAGDVDLRAWVMASLPPYFHVKADLDAEKARIAEKKQAMVEMEKDLAEASAQKEPAEKTTNEVKNAANTPEKAEKPEEIETKPAENANPVPETVKTITLKNGRSFCVTADKEEWQRLTDAGQVVFSEHELKRLQQACKNMNPQERLDAAMLVLDMKQLFPSAWISRGEEV
jgi:type II secretory pathway component PulJ